MTYNYTHTANSPQHFRHRPWWCRACWEIQKRMLLKNGIAPGGVDLPGHLYKDWPMVDGSIGCRGFTPAFKIKLLPAEPQGTCGTLPPSAAAAMPTPTSTTATSTSTSTGRCSTIPGSWEEEAGGWEEEAGSCRGTRRRRRCEDALPKIARDVSSARMDRDWVQSAADSCHRLQGTSGEPCEHTSRWLSHH